MRRARSDNAQHAELLAQVERGSAAILAEQYVDSHKVQLAAYMVGEEIRLTNWTEDERGGWQCASAMDLPMWALPELAWFLRRPSQDSANEHPALEPLHVGDIVRHKAGGPRMEISGITNQGLAWCVWTVNRETRTAPFELAELIAAQDLLSR